MYMIEFPRTYLANEDSDFFLNFNFAKNIPIAEQILSTFQYMDGGENYISIIIEKGADADFYPPIRKLIGVKNDGSKIVLLNDIDQSLPISRYGAEKGITKTQDNLSQDSFIYSFAQNVQKVYIGRFVDGSEVYDYIHEYDLRLNKIRQINIPATYMSSHNHVRVKSPNGEKVALYGHDGVGVFDLTKNKIIFFLQSEDVDGIFLDADSLVSSPENYIDILFKWRSSTTLEYPIYEQGGNQYPELKTIKTVSF